MACNDHTDHANRIERLEDEMKEVKGKLTSPAIWVALFGFAATVVSSVSAFCAVIAAAYFKSKGWM